MVVREEKGGREEWKEGKVGGGGGVRGRVISNIYFFLYTELLGTPIGTGCLYVADQERSSNEQINFEDEAEWTKWLSEQYLIKERRRLNRATESNESLVVQYLVHEGYKQIFNVNDHKLFQVGTAMHTGVGQLVWGMTPHQRCDAMFSFVNPKSYSLIGYVNFHGGYYHYTGHTSSCPQSNDDTPFIPKNEDLVYDRFRFEYAKRMSMVWPDNARFQYEILYECDFFHTPKQFIIDGKSYDTIKQAVLNISDNVYSYKIGKQYNLKTLVKGIADGSITGFVTLQGGYETPSNDANDFFGYCVQQYTPTSSELSEFTLDQIKHFKGNEKYLETKQIGLTLNSGSFHSEETVSTIYLQWLIKTRGFFGYRITHFIEYKFANHCKLFLEPLLQKRHTAKTKKDFVSAECLKLLCNGSFGYNAIESSNYNTCRIITGSTLKRYATSMAGYLSLDRIQLIGIVESKKDVFDFLYSIILSGEDRPIQNCLPKAVAILSNSKKLFLNHIHLLLECLDPALAELCYIDTDSCIFSFTHPKLEQCIRPEKKSYFLKQDIIVHNEQCKQSFHGKLKCEGVYVGGRFRTIKIYRLYTKRELYTRCKGINRYQAADLPNTTFDTFDRNVNTIQRHALKPTSAGEMCIMQESVSLAMPANLKRYVLGPHALHTLPLSIGCHLKK